MVRGQGWKYCSYPDGGEHLYCLADDPGETKNLAAEIAAEGRKHQMRDALKDCLPRTGWEGRKP